MFWRKSSTEMEILNIEEQVINCKIKKAQNLFEGKVSFVYGASMVEERSIL